VTSNWNNTQNLWLQFLFVTEWNHEIYRGATNVTQTLCNFAKEKYFGM
jgi:hypothetical protein